MKVIVGLGNPGLEYYSTWHNAGFRVIDELAIKAGAAFSFKKNWFCELSRTNLSRQEVLLIKPLTYMNESGRAVQAVLNWHKLSPTQLLVIHDEVSLPLGKLRVQKNGGAGGHHGIESIISCLGGSQDFARLRLGVGPDPGGAVRAHYLLSAPLVADQEVYKACIEAASQAVLTILTRGLAEAMNKFNGLQLDPRIKEKDHPAVGSGPPAADEV